MEVSIKKKKNLVVVVEIVNLPLPAWTPVRRFFAHVKEVGKKKFRVYGEMRFDGDDEMY